MRRLLFQVLAATMTLVLVTLRPATAGGPISSGSTVSGTLSGPTFKESWTFNGTAGDRILVAAITTSGAVNTVTSLIPPGGGAAEISTAVDRVDWSLGSTGVYTITVEDLGLNDAGTYGLGFLNVTAGPLTGGGDLDGGALASAEIHSGTTGTVADFDAWTFTGGLNDRVIVSAVATTGVPYATNVALYPPGGGGAVFNTSADRSEFKLTAAGTWTIVVEDGGDNDTGGYNVSLLNITSGPLSNGSDPDGTTIASNGLQAGTFNAAADLDAFQFTATAGDRILIGSIATGAGTHNTTTYIYPPGGGVAEYSSAVDRADLQLAATGTYTIVVEDLGQNETGTYSLGLLNLTAGPLTDGSDLDGGAIASAEIHSGTTGTVADFDAWTFTGGLNDRVIVSAVATTGVPYGTNVALYPPGGGGAVFNTSTDRNEFKLTAAGTWTIVVEDSGDNDTGGYNVSLLNITSGPLSNGSDPDGTTIAPNETRTGSFGQFADLDAFQFTATAGDRIVLTAIATGGGGHNTTVYLYPPGGGAAEYTSAVDRSDLQLQASGLYTVVINDLNLLHTGAYVIGLMNVSAGPWTGAGEPEGDLAASGVVRAGSTGGPCDLDAFRFNGAAGDRVIIAAVATGGAGYTTAVSLYPPSGGAAAIGTTANDRVEYQLTSSGAWTIMVEDSGNDVAGSYNLSMMNIGSGSLTSGADSDGGALLPGAPAAGQINPVADLDGYHFYGESGQTATLAAVATSGPLNTTMYVYPPGGGAAVAQTAVDNLNVPLAATGNYTVVVQDLSLANTGSYTLTLAGTSPTSGLPGDNGPAAPAIRTLALLPAAPSPFRTGTRLTWEVPGEGPVRLRIFDAAGALVRTLVEGMATTGRHESTWDGRDEAGRPVGSGVYYSLLEGPGGLSRQKVVRIQ